MKTLKFIISGGGTGGHIFPAIAIADELKRRYSGAADILFVGARDRMEMTKVPKAGYAIKGLWISGIQRKLTLRNLMFPVKLIYSLIKSRRIIKKFNPDVVIGTGGYASAPLLRVASQNGLPTLLQEQNSYAGVTNKWLAAKAQTICVAYDNMDTYFPEEKIVFTGNPVRQNLLNAIDNTAGAREYYHLDDNRKTLLVIGGSLGAQIINEYIAKNNGFFDKHNVQVVWQCGALYYERFKSYDQNPGIHLYKFLDRMDLAYSAADFVLSRAGAISVSELCLVGKPVIFIPSPNVAEDHQTKNAKALSDRNAALLIEEAALENRFKSVFLKLLRSEKQQEELSQNIKKMAKPNATSAIVDEIEKLIEKKTPVS